MAKVIALRPLNTTVAGVRFTDGEAITRNAGALAYFRRRDGYRVEDTPTPRRRPAKAEGGKGKADTDEEGDE